MDLKIFKLNMKNFNFYTVLSILMLLAGILFWIYWGIRYGVWYNIGPYSVSIVLIIPGIVGIILTLIEREEKTD